MKEFDFLSGEVLLFDKPLNWTSFQLVNKVRYIIQAKLKRKLKVGHAGTLDPLATGLLIICTGKETKNISSYQGMEKEYDGVIRVGSTTPSFDLETEVNKTFDTSQLTLDSVKNASQSFVGDIMQTPPLFSAVKVKGVRAYTHARKGEDVKLASKPIHIRTFEVEKFENPDLHFRIACSKGTYIRAIARDIGETLEVGGHLTKLRRTKIGDYDLKKAISLQEFEYAIDAQFVAKDLE